MRMKAPFNVAHVIAHNPTAPRKYQVDSQLQQTERDGIRQAIAPGHYRLVEKPGSIEQIQEALREHSYHIVHFLGHGELHRADDIDSTGVFTGRGYLRFVSVEGEIQLVTGDQLQLLLGLASSVQLVVLNACYGASGAARSIALELVYNGLPNVIAIQSHILQDAAQYFIEAFYAELKRGQSVEYAVAIGRFAIAINMPQTIDWCLPVLYTSVGISEEPPSGKLAQLADRLWHWIGSPSARRGLIWANTVLAPAHFLFGILLLLRNLTPILPSVHITIAVGLTIIPVLLTTSAYLLGPLQIPKKYPIQVKAVLMARSFRSAALWLGLPSLYIWSALMFLVLLGSWNILSLSAQAALLYLIFILGLALSGLFSYSQLVSHSRAFIANAQVELPAFEWGELAIVITGYALLLLPWIARTFLSGLLTPPWGNFVLCVLLLVLGYLLYKEGQQDNRP
jgi:hypothetical protein